MFSNSGALFTEGMPNPGAAVRLATLPVDLLNIGQEFPSCRRPGTLRPGSPRLIARWRDSQGAAHQAKGIAASVSLNDLVSHRDSFAKNAAARFKKSRSCCNVAFSRRSRTSSAWSARAD